MVAEAKPNGRKRGVERPETGTSFAHVSRGMKDTFWDVDRTQDVERPDRAPARRRRTANAARATKP